MEMKGWSRAKPVRQFMETKGLGRDKPQKFKERNGLEPRGNDGDGQRMRL